MASSSALRIGFRGPRRTSRAARGSPAGIGMAARNVSFDKVIGAFDARQWKRVQNAWHDCEVNSNRGWHCVSSDK